MHARRHVVLAVALLTSAVSCEAKQATAPATTAPATAPTSVVMSQDAITAAGVKTAKVATTTLTIRADLPGTIEAPRDALVIINAPAAGVVEALDFDIGDKVKAGQRLATLRSVALAEAQASYRRAQATRTFATAALARSTALRDEGVVPQKRVETDQLDADERQLALAEAAAKVRILGGALGSEGGQIALTSPIAGTIASRGANRGQALEANQPIYSVVDVSHVVAQLRAPAGTPVELGAEVSFTVEGLPGRACTAFVKSSSDLLDHETRRFLILCSVDNPDGALKPGMFVTAQLPRAGVRAVVVPDKAIQVLPDGPAVFIAESNGKFTRRNVTLGDKAAGQVAVIQGLADGDTIVVDGAFWVRTQLQRAELEE